MKKDELIQELTNRLVYGEDTEAIAEELTSALNAAIKAADDKKKAAREQEKQWDFDQIIVLLHKWIKKYYPDSLLADDDNWTPKDIDYIYNTLITIIDSADMINSLSGFLSDKIDTNKGTVYATSEPVVSNKVDNMSEALKKWNDYINKIFPTQEDKDGVIIEEWKDMLNKKLK